MAKQGSEGATVQLQSPLDVERQLIQATQRHKDEQFTRVVAKQMARRLYVEQGKAPYEIEKEVHVPASTIRSWADKEGWAFARLRHEELHKKLTEDESVVERALALKETLVQKSTAALKRFTIIENILDRKLARVVLDVQLKKIKKPDGSVVEISEPKAGIAEVRALLDLQARLAKEVKALLELAEVRNLASIQRLENMKKTREAVLK